MNKNSMEVLANITSQNKNLIIGLDSDYSKIPRHLIQNANRYYHPMLEFNRLIVEATNDIVAGYKLNFAFYEDLGWEGIQALQGTFEYIRNHYPDLFLILDAKRGDIDNTNIGSSNFAFKHCQADALTIAPYMGGQSLKPFWDTWKNKMFFVLACTSNEGADEFQERTIERDAEEQKLYQYIAKRFTKTWGHGNIGLVTGATVPDKIHAVRMLVGNEPWQLVPGVGKQGGDLSKAVQAAMNSSGTGFLVNSSRDIIFASSGENFAEQARTRAQQVHDEIKIAVAQGLELRNQSVH